MQTRALRTLVEIGRIGSFAKAADQLNMTLSAVSMQMKSLESDLGAKLFDRTFRPPQLTPVGRAVCAQAERLVSVEQDMIRVCQPTDRLSGTFRIGFVATASVRLLPKFLIRSGKLAPEAQFDVETGLSDDLEARVLSGLLDGAILTGSSTPHPRLSYQILRTERFVYAVPADCPCLTSDALFATLPFFHFMPQTGIGKVIAKQISEPNQKKGKRIYLDSVEAIMECVNEGLGFALLPEPDVQRYIGAQARILETPDPQTSRTLVFASLNSAGAAWQAEKILEIVQF